MENPKEEHNRREKILNLFSHIHTTGGTLVIGGDFFDFWFDYKFVIPKGYQNILNGLQLLSSKGIEIHYVLGNHDYWDFGSYKRIFNAIVHKGDLEFNINGERMLITHGDGLLKNDRGYRLMKKVIRSRLCIFLFKLLHPDWGCALARKVSKTSTRYNHTNEHSESIISELGEFSKLKWEEGYRTILFGHYHQTGIRKSNENQFICMGDWLKHFTVTRLDEDGWHQYSWSLVKNSLDLPT